MSAKTPVSDPTAPSPAAFLLEQNYPNPFNPSTTISFEVRKPSIGYTLDIYDIRGARVRRLAQGFLGRGRHSVSFDGKDERGRDLASGTYLLRLSGDGESQTRKMLLLK
jgi:flagellar hook assembly protein FlgD